MSNSFVRSRRALLAAMLAVTGWLLLQAAVAVVPARATSGFGELARFGEKGTGSGQFTERATDAIAFGVDPTDNSIYVGDEPEEHHFRIQKFSESGTFLGSVSFEVKGSGPEPESGIEGIAVDPSLHRLYVLAVQSRGTEEKVEVDPEVLAAGALYAFSTEPVAGKLEPASGTGTGGLLAGGTVFKPQSKTLGEALLEPSGIAVDPISHDIVVMAKEDRGESVEPSLRIALERITSAGAKGARYVDSKATAFFEEGEEATSPAVSASGKVYVVGGSLEGLGGETVQEIDEIPSNFTSSEPPTAFIQFDPGLNELVTFPGVPVPNEGAGLSIGPNGDFYAYAKVRHESGTKTFAPGVLIFNSSGSELGWTGGQTAQGGPKCVVSFLGHPMVAAGKEERVFMFDSNPEAPQVVELGPGGEGCPTASSSELDATVNGAPVSEPVAPEAEVKLASTLTEANALSVKWSFGDGTEAETTDQHQAPETLHKFATEGEFKVKETIHTDNLESPEFVEEKTIVVKSAVPVARFSGPPAALVEEAVSFDGKNSTDPKSLALTYSWEFGDGASEKTSVSKVLHTYTAAGEYHVTLTVKDSEGHESAPVTHAIVVSAKEAAKEPPKEEPKPQPKEEPKPPPKELPKNEPPPTYELTIAGSSVTVAPSGSLVVKVDCAGTSSCSKGTISLRTLKPVGSGRHKSLMTLASGLLNLAGSHASAVSLRLSGKARALLARLHVLRARVTVIAHDTTGILHTTTFTITLRASKAHGHH
jgi:PKD repeat protein